MKPLFAILCFLMIASCARGPLNETYEFENNRWPAADAKEFNFEIEEAKSYSLFLGLSFVHEPGYDVVPMHITIEGPQGTEEIPLDLELKDKSAGSPNAECIGDICDLEYVVKKNVQLSAGKYKITVSHKFTGAVFLPNVISLKMHLEE